ANILAVAATTTDPDSLSAASLARAALDLAQASGELARAAARSAAAVASLRNGQSASLYCHACARRVPTQLAELGLAIWAEGQYQLSSDRDCYPSREAWLAD